MGKKNINEHQKNITNNSTVKIDSILNLEETKTNYYRQSRHTTTETERRKR